MPGARLFLDSNFLVYVRDGSAPDKQRTVSAWLGEARAAGAALVLSSQVLREYYAVVTRKARLGLPPDEARRDIALYRRWLCDSPDDHLIDAWRIEDAHRFNFYDCLILASALNAGATHVLTEDMQHDQIIDGMRIVNPFVVAFRDLRIA